MKLSVAALCTTLLLSASDFAAADLARRNKPSRKLSKSSSFSSSDCELEEGNLAPTAEGVTTACVGKCGTDIRFINSAEETCDEDQAPIEFGAMPAPNMWQVITETILAADFINGSGLVGMIDCPAGTIAVGGGFSRGLKTDGTSGGSELEMRANGPILEVGTNKPIGWKVLAAVRGGEDNSYDVYAICMSEVMPGGMS